MVRYKSVSFLHLRWQKLDNPHQVIDFKERNFLVIDSETHKDKIKAHVRSIGSESDSFFERDIQVSK